MSSNHHSSLPLDLYGTRSVIQCGTDERYQEIAVQIRYYAGRVMKNVFRNSKRKINFCLWECGTYARWKQLSNLGVIMVDPKWIFEKCEKNKETALLYPASKTLVTLLALRKMRHPNIEKKTSKKSLTTGATAVSATTRTAPAIGSTLTITCSSATIITPDIPSVPDKHDDKNSDDRNVDDDSDSDSDSATDSTTLEYSNLHGPANTKTFTCDSGSPEPISPQTPQTPKIPFLVLPQPIPPSILPSYPGDEFSELDPSGYSEAEMIKNARILSRISYIRALQLPSLKRKLIDLMEDDAMMGRNGEEFTINKRRRMTDPRSNRPSSDEKIMNQLRDQQKLVKKLQKKVQKKLNSSTSAPSTPVTTSTTEPSIGKCVVCLDNSIGMFFPSCGHACVCNICPLRLKKCPLCNTKGSAKKLFLA